MGKVNSIVLSLVLASTMSAEASSTLRQIPAVVHAHSTFSSGDQTLDELITRARAVGIEAIFLSENHLQRFEYGLFPLRNILRYRVEYPSLLSQGPEAFLKAVEAANARQKDVLLIPGTEVIPHYYWTGELFRETLTMYNAQKNLLALGLSRAEDYRGIPAVGNVDAGRWNLRSLWLLSPVALVIPGIWLLRLRRRCPVRLQFFRVSVERRYTGYGILCLALGAVLLANNFPFRTLSVSPYDANAGLGPHQAVIDFINARGGSSVWSMPEARDHQVVTVAGKRATIQTDPDPDDLLHTDGFTAFGGVYEDTTTFTQPGGGWDQLLADYLGGRRTAPAWAIGEAAYHREGQAGKRFGEVQTVILAERKDTASLLGAFKAGRMYALRRTVEAGLALDQFQVSAPGEAPVEAGGWLTVRHGNQPLIRVGVRATTSAPMRVEARLIRSGAMVHTVKRETPFAFSWQETALQPSARVYYRLEVLGPGGHQILANPIFVTVDK